MNYLFKQTLIWIGGYFPFIPRLFGLKVLSIGYIDITPDLCSGKPQGRIVESKVSWLIKNLWGAPLPIKIIISSVKADDGWIQAYPVNQALHGGWNRDISCGEEKFDLELRQKHKKTIVPIEGFLKIDHFAGFQPHPSCGSSFAFQIVPEDKDVIVLYSDFLNQKARRRSQWITRSLLSVFGLFFAVYLMGYFWVQYGDPVWRYFFR